MKKATMPEITVSEELYSQIEAESAGGDMNETLWKMVGNYRRQNNPEADMADE
jgi:hypothetical protein